MDPSTSCISCGGDNPGTDEFKTMGQHKRWAVGNYRREREGVPDTRNFKPFTHGFHFFFLMMTIFSCSRSPILDWDFSFRGDHTPPSNRRQIDLEVVPANTCPCQRAGPYSPETTQCEEGPVRASLHLKRIRYEIMVHASKLPPQTINDMLWPR